MRDFFDTGIIEFDIESIFIQIDNIAIAVFFMINTFADHKTFLRSAVNFNAIRIEMLDVFLR